MNSKATIDMFGYVDPRDEWETPDELFKAADEIFGFDCDMAANKRNRKIESWWYGPDHPDPERRDGLSALWGHRAAGWGWVWCNPPFSQIEVWCKKAQTELVDYGYRSVLLAPAHRSEQKWHHQYVAPYASISHIKGRVNYKPAPGIQPSSPKFPSQLVIYGELPAGFPTRHPLFGIPMRRCIELEP